MFAHNLTIHGHCPLTFFSDIIALRHTKYVFMSFLSIIYTLLFYNALTNVGLLAAPNSYLSNQLSLQYEYGTEQEVSLIILEGHQL